jgi:hypothetical protein
MVRKQFGSAIAAAAGVRAVVAQAAMTYRSKIKEKKNIQQPGFAGGHPPNY